MRDGCEITKVIFLFFSHSLQTVVRKALSVISQSLQLVEIASVKHFSNL